MARSQAGRLLTIGHRQRQVQLRAATLLDLSRLWPLWDGQRIARFGDFAEPATVLVRDRFQVAAGLAVAYYQALRVAEAVGGTPAARVADPPTVDRVIGNLRATGLAGTMRAIRAGFSPDAARQSGLVQAMGSAGRMVMRGGIESMVLTSTTDNQAKGWQRITGSKPCDFCLMLAGRGAVYSSETSDFQSHDHCSCTAEPVF